VLHLLRPQCFFAFATGLIEGNHRLTLDLVNNIPVWVCKNW
jgi:hypothetical protein